MLCSCEECWPEVEEIYTRFYEALKTDDCTDNVLSALMMLAGQAIPTVSENDEETKEYITVCMGALTSAAGAERVEQ
jgi:hypothetical protein